MISCFPRFAIVILGKIKGNCPENDFFFQNREKSGSFLVREMWKVLEKSGKGQVI